MSNETPSFSYSPTYADGIELVETINNSGGIVVERVRVDGKPYERRFNRATGDSDLYPLF